jgi:large subunit ribosomal protein L10
VLSDSTVLEAGEEVSAQLANVLSELEIEPKEVGLDLRGVYSDGVLFDPEDLAIDIDEYRADVQAAASAARNVSVNAVYPTAQTAGLILGKASTNARAVGISAAIESPDLADDLVAKADAQMRALAAVIDDEEALPEELRGADVAAPADDGADEDTADEESTDDQSADADAEADDTDDDDDDDDGGDAMGALFG